MAQCELSLSFHFNRFVSLPWKCNVDVDIVVAGIGIINCCHTPKEIHIR